MLRVEALAEVGLLAEELFLYCEDLDLSLRLRRAGWSTWVLPAVSVIHDYTFAGSAQKRFYLERNRLYIWSRLWRRRTLLLLAPAMIATEVAVNLLAAYQGWLGQKLRGYRALVSGGAWMRPAPAASRGPVSDRDLMESASGGIDSGEFAHPFLQLLWRCLYFAIRW
jgi:GT2 family glycosyltransferase